MPFYRINGCMVHMRMDKRQAAKAPAPCLARIATGDLERPWMKCCAMSAFLCDWDMGRGSTCSAPMCAEHAKEIGPDRHLCPQHAAVSDLLSRHVRDE